MSIGRQIEEKAGWIRALSGLLMLGALVSALQLLPMAQLFESLRAWIDGIGVWGPLAYAAIYVLATVALLPGTIITLGAGALFGPWVGTLVVSVSSVAGASLAFLIARYLARARVERLLHRNPRYEAVDRAIGEGGWKVVALLRLSPAIPFNLSNYLYGITAIRFSHYVLTSWVAMAPATFLYVYLGYLSAAGIESAVGAESGSAATEMGTWALRIIGLAATLGITLYITRLARNAIHEQTRIDDAPAPTTAADAPPSAPSRPASGTLALLAVALLCVAAAGMLRQKRADVERVTTSWIAGEDAAPPRPEADAESRP